MGQHISILTPSLIHAGIPSLPRKLKEIQTEGPYIPSGPTQHFTPYLFLYGEVDYICCLKAALPIKQQQITSWQISKKYSCILETLYLPQSRHLLVLFICVKNLTLLRHGFFLWKISVIYIPKSQCRWLSAVH